jgi:LuxR family transcriptional regulator, quorum-sensing system regulator SinR
LVALLNWLHQPVRHPSKLGFAGVDQDLLEKIESEEADGHLEELLGLISRRYDLRSVIYICPSFVGFSFPTPFIVQPRCRGWADWHEIQSRLSTDPMVRATARAALPKDWAQLRRNSTDRTGVLFLRNYAGISRQGMTIPVRGPSNSTWALLIATSDESEFAWAARRHELMTDLVHVAHYVHQRACQIHGEGRPINLDAITRREIEALTSAAEGRKLNEIATLMRISQETVRAHLDSARDKLQALNRVHAVAKALRAGLIS